jgi:DNA-binding response OmpR family regulator
METSQTHISSSHIGSRILLYEDDQEISHVCRLILEKNHYHVDVLSRCENAGNDINTYKPDLILMDLWIPEIGGEKAVKLIKENADTRHIPVLLFSANAEIQEICKRVNADGYIEKPFDIKSLIEKIRKFI